LGDTDKKKPCPDDRRVGFKSNRKKNQAGSGQKRRSKNPKKTARRKTAKNREGKRVI